MNLGGTTSGSGAGKLLNIPPDVRGEQGVRSVYGERIFSTQGTHFPIPDKRLHAKEAQPTNQKVGSSNLSGRAMKEKKGPAQAGPFFVSGANAEGLRTPDVVGRSTTAHPRGRTLRHRG